MSEFNDAPGVPSGDNPGQAEDSNQEQDRKPVNLDDLPEFRNWKSNSDRKLSEKDRQLQEAQRIAREAQERMEAERTRREAIESTLRDTDPDAFQMATQQAYIRDLERKAQSAQAREQELQQQQQLLQWRRDQEEMAREQGIDPGSDTFQKAMRDAERTGDGRHVINALIRLAKEGGGASAPSPAKPEKPATDYSLPPTGGSSTSGGRARLLQEFAERKRKLPQGDLNALHGLRREFLQKGLERSDVGM